MKSQQRPSLLALSALLLCTLQQTAGSSRSDRSSASSSSSSSSSTAASASSPSVTRGSDQPGTHKQATNSGNQESRPSPKVKENSFSVNTSRGDVTSVMSDRSGGAPSWSRGDRVSSLCAYRVIEGGIGGQLCFRHTLFGYKCGKEDCRTVVSLGNLAANLLTNGSVLLQWSGEGESATTGRHVKTKEAAVGWRSSGALGTNLTRSHAVFNGRRHGRGGYELRCWWNGSYTQFECAGVHLGLDCRDFVLTELHENIPYRICLHSLARHDPAGKKDQQQQDCVEFTLPPSGMQDIVIAMTTVGGAICVMLVIICLLVAYITENIMSPTTQHTYSYRTHSRH